MVMYARKLSDVSGYTKISNNVYQKGDTRYTTDKKGNITRIDIGNISRTKGEYIGQKVITYASNDLAIQQNNRLKGGQVYTYSTKRMNLSTGRNTTTKEAAPDEIVSPQVKRLRAAEKRRDSLKEGSMGREIAQFEVNKITRPGEAARDFARVRKPASGYKQRVQNARMDAINQGFVGVSDGNVSRNPTQEEKERYLRTGSVVKPVDFTNPSNIASGVSGGTIVLSEESRFTPARRKKTNYRDPKNIAQEVDGAVVQLAEESLYSPVAMDDLRPKTTKAKLKAFGRGAVNVIDSTFGATGRYVGNLDFEISNKMTSLLEGKESANKKRRQRNEFAQSTNIQVREGDAFGAAITVGSGAALLAAPALLPAAAVKGVSLGVYGGFTGYATYNAADAFLRNSVNKYERLGEAAFIAVTPLLTKGVTSAPISRTNPNLAVFKGQPRTAQVVGTKFKAGTKIDFPNPTSGRVNVRSLNINEVPNELVAATRGRTAGFTRAKVFQYTNLEKGLTNQVIQTRSLLGRKVTIENQILNNQIKSTFFDANGNILKTSQGKVRAPPTYDFSKPTTQSVSQPVFSTEGLPSISKATMTQEFTSILGTSGKNSVRITSMRNTVPITTDAVIMPEVAVSGGRVRARLPDLKRGTGEFDLPGDVFKNDFMLRQADILQVSVNRLDGNKLMFVMQKTPKPPKPVKPISVKHRLGKRASLSLRTTQRSVFDNQRSSFSSYESRVFTEFLPKTLVSQPIKTIPLFANNSTSTSFSNVLTKTNQLYAKELGVESRNTLATDVLFKPDTRITPKIDIDTGQRGKQGQGTDTSTRQKTITGTTTDQVNIPPPPTITELPPPIETGSPFPILPILWGGGSSYLQRERRRSRAAMKSGFAPDIQSLLEREVRKGQRTSGTFTGFERRFLPEDWYGKPKRKKRRTGQKKRRKGAKK